VPGTKVCRFHGGNAANVRAAGARRLAEAEATRQVVTLGLPVDISPTEALLQEVQWTAGHVHWLRSKVQDIDEEELVWGATSESTKQATQFPGTDSTSTAAPSIWYVLYAKERQHLVAVCAAALKAGVEERRVRLAESQGDLVATAIRHILDALNLTPEQAAQVPRIVPEQLRLIAGGQA